MGRRALNHPDAAVVEEIRRAVRLAMGFKPFISEGWVASYLGLSSANAALFMLGDPSVPATKLPRIGSKAMYRFTWALSRATEAARAADRGDAADQLEAALERIDPDAAACLRARREEARRRTSAEPKPARDVYVARGIGQSIEISAIASDGTQIVLLAVDPRCYHDKLIRFVEQFLEECDPQPTTEQNEPSRAAAEDLDDDDDNAGEEWKRS